jgi:hypothetical protein
MTTDSEQIDHDPATCPGCLHAARQDGGRPEAAAAWAVAAIGMVCVVVVFAVALYLIAGNTFAVLAR